MSYFFVARFLLSVRTLTVCLVFWWCAPLLYLFVASPSSIQHARIRRPVAQPDFVSILPSVCYRSQHGNLKIWLPLPTGPASAFPPMMLPCPTTVPATIRLGTTLDALPEAATLLAAPAGAGVPGGLPKGECNLSMHVDICADYLQRRRRLKPREQSSCFRTEPQG